jgi:hypothetical protein
MRSRMEVSPSLSLVNIIAHHAEYNLPNDEQENDRLGMLILSQVIRYMLIRHRPATHFVPLYFR